MAKSAAEIRQARKDAAAKRQLQKALQDGHSWAQEFGANLAANMIWNKYGFATRVKAGRVEILSGFYNVEVLGAVELPAE